MYQEAHEALACVAAFLQCTIEIVHLFLKVLLIAAECSTVSLSLLVSAAIVLRVDDAVEQRFATVRIPRDQ